jgi:hypothetical protein
MKVVSIDTKKKGWLITLKKKVGKFVSEVLKDLDGPNIVRNDDDDDDDDYYYYYYYIYVYRTFLNF